MNYGNLRAPVVHTRNPARLVRQKRSDHRPLEIRQIKARHFKTPIAWNLGSHIMAFGNQIYGCVIESVAKVHSAAAPINSGTQRRP